MFDFNKPLWMNWELNNICNLMCPQCRRNEIRDGELVKKDGMDNRDNSLETFKKVYKNIGHPVGLIRFQGQLSENVASKDFLPICDFIISQGTTIGLSTHGSLRSKDWWYRLGEVFAKDNSFVSNPSSSSHVFFCIDGMGPELGLYRIGANYDKIIENAQAFIKGGGNAIWRMIIFKHNQYQIEEAEKEATRLGFSDFVTCHTDRRSAWQPFTYKGKEYNLEIQDRFPEWNKKVTKNEEFRQGNTFEPIACKAVDENQFYINCYNKVWACYYLPDYDDLAEEQDWYREYHEDDSNNLEEKTFDEILENKFYEALQMSWDVESKCLSMCKRKCSVFSGITRQFEFASGRVVKNLSGGSIQKYFDA